MARNLTLSLFPNKAWISNKSNAVSEKNFDDLKMVFRPKTRLYLLNCVNSGSEDNTLVTVPLVRFLIRDLHCWYTLSGLEYADGDLGSKKAALIMSCCSFVTLFVFPLSSVVSMAT